MTGGDVGAFRSRSSLPSQLHSTIDSCLKALRTATKAFAALETTLAEERQILERLYYKGKNQHRSALFWRRVGDMRRVLKKMDGSSKFRISNTLERVRGSFHESGGAELSNKAWVIYMPSAELTMLTVFTYNLDRSGKPGVVCLMQS